MFDFTISWARLLPNGTGSVPLKAGVDFYRDVIKASNKAGMDNFCTLYHWDLPQTLQDKYRGWLSSDVVEDFENYAKVVFDAFGDICHNWVTMNEPRTFCTEGQANFHIISLQCKLKATLQLRSRTRQCTRLRRPNR